VAKISRQKSKGERGTYESIGSKKKNPGLSDKTSKRGHGRGDIEKRDRTVWEK